MGGRGGGIGGPGKKIFFLPLNNAFWLHLNIFITNKNYTLSIRKDNVIAIVGLFTKHSTQHHCCHPHNCVYR